MKRLFTLGITCLLVASTSVWGQTATPEDYKEWLELTTGRWAMLSNTSDSLSGDPEEGGRPRGYSEAIPACDGTVQIHRNYFSGASSTSITFYDAATSRIRVVGASSRGTTWDESIYKEGGLWTYSGTGSAPSGKPRITKWKAHIQEDGRTWIFEGTVQTGDNPPAARRNTWRRIGP